MGRRKRRAAPGELRAPRLPQSAAASPDWHAPALAREWPHLLAVSLLLLGVYVYSMPRHVTLEDSGIFTLSCFFAGISHPPGYPIHSVLGKLFTYLPAGSAAMRVGLLSAVLGALACSVLWWIVLGLVRSRTAAYAASLGYGVSRVFWSQAIIAEVYTLNALLVFLLLGLCLDHAATGRPERLRWIALVFGLGLAHHYPLFLLASPLFAFVMWPARLVVLKGLHRLPGWLLLGLLPYVYLAARSWTAPEVSFYGPLDTFPRIVHFIGRRGYSLVEGSPSAGWIDRLHFAGFLSREVLAQYGWPGLGLSALGLALCLRAMPRIALGLCAAFLGSSYLLLLFLRFDYEFLSCAVFTVYPIIPYGMMAVWIGAAAAWIERRAGGGSPLRRSLVGGSLAAALVATLLLAHARVNVRRDYTWARDFARAMLDSLEPGAVLFTHGDSDTGPIGYMNRVEGYREDVEVYNDQGLVFDNRLFQPPVTYEAREKALADFIEREARPVYYMAEIRHRFGTEYLGPLVKVRKDLPQGKQVFTGNRTLLDYLERVLAEERPTDMWTIEQRGQLVDNFTGLVAPILHFATDPAARAAYQGLLDRLTRHYLGKLKLVEVMINVAPADRLLRWADEAEALAGDGVSKAAHARLFTARARVYLRMREMARAEASFERSVAIHSHPDNPAVLELLAIHASRRDRAAYSALRQRVFGAGPVPPRVLELDRGSVPVAPSGLRDRN